MGIWVLVIIQGTQIVRSKLQASKLQLKCEKQSVCHSYFILLALKEHPDELSFPAGPELTMTRPVLPPAPPWRVLPWCAG